MKNIKKEMYGDFLTCNGFYIDKNNTRFSPEGTCFSLLPEYGEGYYWVYTYDNLFAVSIQDFVFYEDMFLKYPQPLYLHVSVYDSVAGEELTPYKRLSCSCIKGHFGHNNLYQAMYHKNIPIRCTGISIMPEYYDDFLRTKYPGEYENPRNAFLSVDGRADFPELMLLLRQIRNFRSTGIAAKLYYESKVTEAISLIVQKTREEKSIYTVRNICSQDLDRLQSVASYIADHFASGIRSDTLSKIACMSTAKLKYTFKAVYQCTISEYILSKRMAQAENLLVNTDFSINQISKAVGYKKTGNFSDAFRKNTGLLPHEYRKFAASK